MNEKKWIKMFRFISLLILVFIVSFPIIVICFTQNIEVFIVYCLFPPALVFFICSLTLNYKEYQYKGYRISVYAGFSHRFLKVNDEKCDEYNAIDVFTPITLSTTLSDESIVSATISTSRRIIVKVNNKLI